MKKTAYLLYLGFIITGNTISTNANAELYKWVDEDGNTHYSQSPPNTDASIEVTTIKPPPKIDASKSIKEQEERRKKLDDLVKNRKEKAEAESKEKEKLTLKEDNCKKARAKLGNNQNTGRIRAVDEEGNIVRATEEERQRRIKDAQEKVDKWCN